MEVNLNDKAFRNAKVGDIFIIEEKNGSKFATPISKEELFKCEIESINLLRKDFNELKKSTHDELEKQKETIENYTNSIYEFIEIMKGETNNE